MIKYVKKIMKSQLFLRFLAAPIVILATNYAIAEYLKEKVGYIVQSCITLIGNLIFTVSNLILLKICSFQTENDVLVSHITK